jgi:dihydrofolate reductase
MPRICVYIAASLDGYIARPDGSLDWLESAAAPGEDYGYDEFLAGVDALAMGSGTYGHIEGIDPMPFGDRPVFVFTHRDAPPRPGVVFWAPDPVEAVDRWDEQGFGSVYLDGGRLISSFLAEDLVDEIVLTVVPTLLGAGLPLFHRIGRSIALSLRNVRSWPSGMAQLHYVRPAP